MQFPKSSSPDAFPTDQIPVTFGRNHGLGFQKWRVRCANHFTFDCMLVRTASGPCNCPASAKQYPHSIRGVGHGMVLATMARFTGYATRISLCALAPLREAPSSQRGSHAKAPRRQERKQKTGYRISFRSNLPGKHLASVFCASAVLGEAPESERNLTQSHRDTDEKMNPAKNAETLQSV